MTTLRFCPTLLTLAMLVAAPAALVADDVRVGNAVAKLFEVGWDTSVKSRTEADKWFAIAQQYEPGDPRTTYAYALVQLMHRDFAGASKSMDDVLAVDRDNAAAHKAKVWLSMITKNYTAALLGMEQLSQLLPDPAVAETPSRQQRDVAEFLGRMFAFLEGPAAGAVGDAQLGDYEAKIGARLVGPLESEFEAARRGIDDQFTALLKAKEEADALTRVAAEEERRRLLAELDETSQQIDQRRDELGPIREKIVNETQSELDKIATEERPLGEILLQLEAQANIVRREWLLASTEMSRMQALAARERDPILRSGFLGEMTRLSIMASRYTADMRFLENRAAGINRQRADIQRRQAQTRGRAVAEIKKIDQELADLDKQQRRLEADRKKTSRPSRRTSSRSRALATRAAAFTTYEKFPLEEEKERLLALFR